MVAGCPLELQHGGDGRRPRSAVRLRLGEPLGGMRKM
jgi:hypothetical protein